MSRELILERPINVAVVGCGRISASHFKAIEKFKHDLQLVAVCDTDPDRLETLKDLYSVKAHPNLESLLSLTKPDLVILCTPSGLHSEQASMAASHGSHVVTEKPMATRWKDGMRMVKACDKAGVRLFVVKQNRRNQTVQAVKKAILAGRFGKIHMVHSNVFWSRPQSYYDQDKWRGTWEFDGGAFMNQASHYVDLLEWLIGPVQSVQAMMGTLARNIEVEDTGTLNLRWRSGTIGSMSVTMLCYKQNLEGSITIIGEKGTVKIGGVALNEIQHWEFADKHPQDEDITQLNYDTASVYGHGHVQYYENVIKVLRGQAQPETDGREGLRSLELLIAAYLSAKESKTIHLPLEI